MRTFFILLVSLALPLSIGLAMEHLVADGLNGWYVTLDKPVFSPPPAVIVPLWRGLFFLMGVSLFLIYLSADQPERKKGLHLFLIQMLLFVAGNVLFFRFHLIGWSLLEMYVTWIYLMRALFAFRLTHYLATILQLPYFAVVCLIQVMVAVVWYQNNWNQ